MKKIIALLLCLVLTAAVLIPAVYAGSNEQEAKAIVADSYEDALATAKRENCPIVFVTGIGQSWSYITDGEPEPVDEATMEAAKTDPTFYAGDGCFIYDGMKYHYTSRRNLFIIDPTTLFSSFDSIFNSLRFVAQVLKTFAFDKYLIDKDVLASFVSDLMAYNIIDENGKLPANVLTPRYSYPLSEYTLFSLDRFYRDVPISKLVDEYGSDRIFCYNYAPFGNVYDISEGLDSYINDVVLGEYCKDAEKVVLVPMSMGAAMTSAYLQDYGSNDVVSKVISVVGAWDGSEVVADLIEQKFVEDSAERFYGGLWQTLVGDFGGSAIELVLRCIPKEVASTLVDEALTTVCEELLFKTPTLLALIPSGRYEAIKRDYLSGEQYADIVAQTDKYYIAQTGLKNRMAKLNTEQDVEFYFMCGYNLSFGGSDNSDYTIFSIFDSAAKVNSDEIIQITSTAPGATAAAAGESLPESYLASLSTDEFVSPNKSVDLSTSYYPDHCWLFNRQKHELGGNNTTLKIAIGIAKGEVENASDSLDKYPRFNEEREVRDLEEDYIPAINRFIEANESNPEMATQVADAKALLVEIDAMLERTVNDPESDNAICLKAKAYQDAEDAAKAESKSTWDKITDKIGAVANDGLTKFFMAVDKFLDDKVGAKGISDIF